MCVYWGGVTGLRISGKSSIRNTISLEFLTINPELLCEITITYIFFISAFLKPTDVIFCPKIKSLVRRFIWIITFKRVDK